MKKFLSGVLATLALMGLVFASTLIYNSLTVNGPVAFTNLPLDGAYPSVSIDSGGNLYQNELHRGAIYLSGTYDLTTTGASTWYEVTPSWEQEVLQGWTTSGTSWVYQGQDSYILFIYTATVTSDTNNTNVTAGLKFNGAIENEHNSTAWLDTTAGSATLANVATHFMTSGDIVDIIIQSDKAGAVITYEAFSASAFRF